VWPLLHSPSSSRRLLYVFPTCRDEALTRLLSTYAPEPSVVGWTNEPISFADLSTSTVRRNKDLENRVAELEVELLVWKQAHSVAIEASEREVKAHNVQLAALNRQISNMDSFKSVSCLRTVVSHTKPRCRTIMPSYYVSSTGKSSFLTASSLPRDTKVVGLPPNN